jgi:hypothetical protein
MEKTTKRPALTVIEGDGPLPDHHPLKWLLRPCLVVVWDREADARRADAPMQRVG